MDPSATLETFRARTPSARVDLLRSLQRIEPGRHLVRLATFLLIYGLAAAAAVLLVRAVPGWGGIALAAPLYVLAGASLHGVSLFTHEGVHGALSRNRHVNRAIATACALPVLQNFSAYRVLHLRHHGDTAGESDPDHYANYSPRPAILFLMHWTRLLLGYPFYITAIPVLGLVHGRAWDRAWTLVELALLAAALSAAIAFVPGEVLLHAWALPMVAVHFIVNVRGMSQHTLLEDPHHRVRGTRSILTGRVVSFFMIHENLHLEHHLYPAVPWYHLPRLHEELAADLRAERAPFIPSYGSFVRDFARRSLDLLRPT